MKAPALLSLALTLTITAPIARPTQAAEVIATQTATATPKTTGIVIPQTAGVIIKLPMNITVDVGQKQDYPLTVPLAQPLYDAQGNEVVPMNTPVAVKFKPENGGARIVAESIVVRGQIIAIQAATPVVPGATIEQVSGSQRARENSGVFGNLFGSVMGAVAPGNKKADMFDQGGLIGGAIGIVSGLSSPKNLRVVQLPADSVHILALQAPITLPGVPQPTPASGPAAPPSAQSFNFRTVLEYAQGVEAVLAAYKQKQISLTEATQAIAAADQYATTVLTPKLYPPAGVRRQVTEQFKFTYTIDRR